MSSLSTNSIHQDYITQNQSIAPLFRWPLIPDWNKLSKQVKPTDTHRNFMDELIRQNSFIEHDKVKKHVAALSHDNSRIVITGQQLGLFISPLYTIYKIISTIRLSDYLQSHVEGYQFVPVFWLEGEDHDFAEVQKMYYWDAQNELKHVKYEEHPQETGISINKRYLNKNIVNLLEILENDVQDTDFSATLWKHLNRIYKPGLIWTEGFAEHLRSIFNAYGLLLFNPGLPEVKRKSRLFFEQWLDNVQIINNAIKNNSATLLENNYFTQAHYAKERSNISLSYEDGERQHVLLEGEKYRIKERNLQWNGKQINKLLKDHPEWFSSTVLSRPVWQSWMLPVVSYVAGPSEIAYWAQLIDTFNTMELTMPHLQPRISVTLLEPKITRLLQKYELEENAIPIDKKSFIQEIVRKRHLHDTETEFKELDRELLAWQDRILMKTKEIDTTLEKQVNKSFDNARKGLSKLHKKLIGREEEKHNLMVNHLETIYQSYYPDKKAQERVLGSLYYFNKFGEQWLERVMHNTDIFKYEHQYVRL
ncbi:MAG: bacillithiol biosynthesis cysteine-adding enzyme BshC [Caldithrix sp.]|nr:bacillithiol biosynthesis cysteine-adding enzyme BshC [Caldithrix sp.]